MQISLLSQRLSHDTFSSRGNYFSGLVVMWKYLCIICNVHVFVLALYDMLALSTCMDIWVRLDILKAKAQKL